MKIYKKNTLSGLICLAHSDKDVIYALSATGLMMLPYQEDLMKSNVLVDIDFFEARNAFYNFHSLLMKMARRISEGEFYYKERKQGDQLGEYYYGNSNTLIAVIDTPYRAQISVEPAPEYKDFLEQIKDLQVKDVSDILIDLNEMTKVKFENTFEYD